MKKKKHKNIFHSDGYQLFLLTLLILTFAISIIAFQRTASPNPDQQTIDVQTLLAKMTAHQEAIQYADVQPTNIFQITPENLDSFQAQIEGLGQSHVGSYLIQYPDALMIYNYDTDEIRVIFAQNDSLPPDFFTKLHNHQEAQGLEGEQPVGGKLDQATLQTLQEQFPEIYKKAKAGDYLLRYQSKLIIYDYERNSIVNAVDLP